MDTIYANMASIPDREEALEQAVSSIIDQVDFLNVFLNGYRHTPSFLKHSKITVVRSQDEGDNGDAGKFFWVEKLKGYYFTIDDDLEYPEGYVEYLIDGIEKRKRKAIIGVHGLLMHNTVLIWFKSVKKFLGFMHKVDVDTPACVLGTGASAFHTDTIELSHSFFSFPNMADTWLTLACHRQAIPRIVLAHPKDYLIQLDIPPETSIYLQTRQFEKSFPIERSKEVEIIQECLPWQYLEDVI